jgi:uncharacterized repeat protein (TIGR02543 family)
MKKLAIALCFAITFTMPALAQQTHTSSGTWTYNGYDYELWSQDNAGTTSMTLNGDNGSGVNAKGGTFSATWQKTINVLFRAGRKFSTTSGGTISGREPPKPALDYGNISVEFAATWSSTDNVKMLGIYGWAFYASGSVPTKQENGTNSSFSNQIEYYIIQDRGTYNSATSGTNSKKYGSGTIDGIAYDYYVCDRLNQPMLTGNGNFKQYFSVPQSTGSHRQSGTISVSKHFQEWARVGMKMDGPLYEVAMKVESYTGSNSNANGSATVTKNLLTIGDPVPAGNYTLDVAPSTAAGGTVTKNPDAPYYASGASVSVTATPASGYQFDGWSGDATGTTNPLSVTMNANKTITAKFSRIPDATTNLVKNGTFTSTSNWTLNKWQNSAGTFAVSGGKANITGITLPSGEGAAAHSLQLVQNGIELTQGTRYIVSFDASAASARYIGLMIQKDVDPWTGYYSKDTINLTTTTQTFTYEFEMTDPTDDNARIAFNFGNATPNVTISNVKIGYALTTKIQNSISAAKFMVHLLGGKMLKVESNANSAIYLYDVRGNLAQKAQVTSGSSTVKLSVPSGVYVIKYAKTGQTQTLIVK